VRVGFIGLGTMGSPMALNIIKGGYGLIGYDTYADAIKAVVDVGAIAGASPRSVAEQAEVVITMLPEPTDVEQVVLGADGIAEGLKSGSVYVDMSTGSPSLAQKIERELSNSGIASIDCPVGRGQAEAVAGSLLLMAGGDAAAIERVLPVLMRMGNELIHCGGPGMGQAMKLTNNMLATIAFQGTTEAVTLGLKAGLRLETMLKVMSQTMANNAVLSKAFPAKAFKGDFHPGFKLRLGRKDMGLAVALAHELGVPVPLATNVLQVCSTLVAAGRGEEDIGVMLDAQAEVVRVRARLEV
jgi:4-hydroxybutyrate dehydrogenase/sulfolactaldehyde 3-reductase